MVAGESPRGVGLREYIDAKRREFRLRREERERIRRFRRADRVILGGSPIDHPGWLTTGITSLNVLRHEDFARFWREGTRRAFLAEHVWEHLDADEAAVANRNCYRFLRPGGRLRIAVPDGLHPDAGYIEKVRPGGSGDGSDDHKQLYDYRTISRPLEECGFRVELLEYWDEKGEFHQGEWQPEEGPVSRSAGNDPRNRDGNLNYTSLIVDAVRPEE